MSRNPSASADAGRYRDDEDGLGWIDLLAALLFHLLAATLVLAAMYWERQHRPEPVRRIQVQMISAAELAKMQHRQTPSRPKPRPAARPKAKPAPTPPKPARHRKQAEDTNFDPFAPLVSKTSPTTARKEAAPNRELVEMIGKQITSSELERIIARIQARVQAQWKVPVLRETVRDPLVEMRLSPRGEVTSIRILESSGNRALDDSLVRAIRAAAPFDIPIEHYAFFRVNRLRFHPLR